MKNALTLKSTLRRLISVATIAGTVVSPIVLSPAVNAAEKPALPSAEEIIKKFVDAIGGKEAYSKINSQHAKGTFGMPAQGISGKMEVFAKRPDKLAVKITLPGLGEILKGYNGEAGWSVDAMTGPRVLEGKELQEFAEQADFDGVLHATSLFKSMKVAGIVDFEGQKCFQLDLVRTSGNKSTEFYDTATGLLTGVKSTAETPLGPLPVTSILRDYKESAGIRFATKVSQKMEGFEQVMTISESEENTVEDSAFDVPDQIKPMLKNK